MVFRVENSKKLCHFLKIQHPKHCFRLRTIGAKIQKNNSKNLTPGASKNSLNATKRIIQKAFPRTKVIKL